jgi:uncharacterized protein
MKLFRTIIATLAALASAASLLVAHAQDPVIDQAKAQGVVGEMYTGYLGVADEGRATADIRRRMEEVNSKRLALYTQLSQEQKQPVATVAALTAEKLISRAESGEAVKPGASQPWTRKP